MTKSRGTSRSIAAALSALAVLISGAVGASPALAREAPLAPPRPESVLDTNIRQAPISSGGLDLASINAPLRVTRPGAKSLHRIGFTNTATPPVRIWFRMAGDCFDGNGNRTWAHKAKAVKIPSGGARPDSRTRAIRYAWFKVPTYCKIGSRAAGRDGNYKFELSTRGGANFTRYRYGSGGGGFLLGRAPSAYRYNLTLAKRPPGAKKNYQAHHTMPRKYRAFFAKRDLDIDDTIHLLWWCSKKGYKGSHGAKAKAYNADWERWINKHPKAKREQVWRFRAKMITKYAKYYRCPS